MSGHIALEIEVGDDGVVRHSFRADALDPDAVPMLVLGAVQAIVSQRIRQDMEDENPLGNADFMAATSALEGRLMLMDMVVHLPAPGQDGIITTIE